MRQSAIVSLLWLYNQNVIVEFVRSNRGTVVLVPEYLVTPGLSAKIEEAGGNLLVLESLLTDKRKDELRQESVVRRGRLLEATKSPGWNHAWAEEGVSSVKVAECLLSEAALRLPDLLVIAASLARAAELYSLRLVVLNEDLLPVARTIVAWAREARIPSLLLSHSIYLNEAYTLHGSVHTDILAVFGERGLEAYKDIGFDLGRTRVTGNPAWDDYPQLRLKRAELRAKLAAACALDTGKPILVFGTTWSANLSALGDESLYGDTLRVFLEAGKILQDEGMAVQLVVKDRPQNSHFGRQRLVQLMQDLGMTDRHVAFSTDDAREWVVAADILVSVDSNLSVEAMLAGTPAINLISRIGLFLGPSFSAESGVLDVDGADQLAEALRRLIGDHEFREGLLAAMTQAVPYHNISVDGTATQRFVSLMNEVALPDGNACYVWQSLLDVESTDATQYHNWPRTQLFDLFAHAPRRVLDIGCGAGATGLALKQAYPGAEVFGVEINHAAAVVARGRIDHVLEGKFEEANLEAAGIAPGSLDTVLVADVLEHIYDPWNVLVRLKKYLTPDGQIIASIPNTRNLILMDELSKGNWRYEPWGLLDVTHIRFFTLREIHRFFHETGYRISQLRHNLDGRLIDTFNRYKNQPLFNLEFERMTLKKVTQDELAELCTIQFFVRAELGSVAESDFKQKVAEKEPDYSLWQRGRILAAHDGDLWERYLASWPMRPKVHLALLVLPEHMDRVGVSLQSLSGQLYEGSIITIVTAVPSAAGWQDSEHLRWVQATDRLMNTANRVLAEGDAEWVGVIDAGDSLESHSLLFMIEAARRKSWRLVYSDEDVIDSEGQRKTPNFKPDFNPDLLNASPYVGGLLLVERRLFADLDGYDARLKGMEEHDLVLRASERVPTESIGHVPDVLLHRLEGGGHATCPLGELRDNGRKALELHFERLGLDVEIADGVLPLSWQIRYRHETPAAVSIIVIARDHVTELQRTIEAILTNTVQWPIELLILDACSTDAQTREYLNGLQAMGDPRVRMFRVELEASHAAYCNLIAGEVSSDYVLFLHFDVSPLETNWLAVLMGHAQRPEIGAVGPRLLGADGMVLEAGYVLGVGGNAESAFVGLRFDHPGYAGRALLEQNVSAIGSGAFLTRVSVFRQLGGFDESLDINAAETDYCLRLAELGLRVLWTPHVSLMSGGVSAMVEWAAPGGGDNLVGLPWSERLAVDPAYNRNLSLERGDVFEIESRNALNWDPLPWKPLPRIMAHFADNLGCGQYRILGPMGALVAGGRVQGWSEINLFKPFEVAHMDLDAIVFQRQTNDEQIAILEQHKKLTRALKVFELDDLLINLPGRSIHRHEMPKDIGNRIRSAAALCDRFVVTSEPLKMAYRGMNDDIRVVPNYLERWRWGSLKPLRRQGKKPRVGWVGGISHSGDLEMIADVVRQLSGEVDWVFMGMCPESLRPHVREFHEGLPFGFYPAKVASLNLDLALAPLEINPFNEAKSNLRILEYGVLGYPVICSDIYPYQGDFPVTRVRNRTNDWIRAIREHIADLDATAKQADALRELIKERWMLEDNLDVWLKAWLP